MPAPSRALLSTIVLLISFGPGAPLGIAQYTPPPQPALLPVMMFWRIFAPELLAIQMPPPSVQGLSPVALLFLIMFDLTSASPAEKSDMPAPFAEFRTLSEITFSTICVNKN